MLAGRTIEQCAGWAGRTPDELIDDQDLPWAWSVLSRRIARVGAAAVYAYPGERFDEEPERARLQSLIVDNAARGWRVRGKPKVVVTHLSELLALHDAGSHVRPALEALASILSNGTSTAAELRRLCEHFRTLRRRVRRTRNALVHGGPLVMPVAESVVKFQDDIAASSLRWTLEAHLHGSSPRQYVDAVRDRHRQAYEALLAGGTPQRELFW